MARPAPRRRSTGCSSTTRWPVRFVVRLKGGDPFVFGRGGEEVLACAEAGVPVLVVPGVTSAVAAPAAAGIPVTHRGVAHEFVVVSGHVAPDDPDSLVDWPALARLRGTVCVLMGLKNLARDRGDADRARPGATTPVAVVQEATTATQRTVRTTLATVADDVRAPDLRPPAVVVIGDVVGTVTRRRRPDSATTSAADSADHDLRVMIGPDHDPEVMIRRCGAWRCEAVGAWRGSGAGRRRGVAGVGDSVGTRWVGTIKAHSDLHNHRREYAGSEMG